MVSDGWSLSIIYTVWPGDVMKLFAPVKDWNSHYRLKHGKTPLKCDKCPQISKMPCSWRDHKASHKDKQYACTVCDQKFSYKSSIQIHRQVHLKQKLFCALWVHAKPPINGGRTYIQTYKDTWKWCTDACYANTWAQKNGWFATIKLCTDQSTSTTVRSIWDVHLKQHIGSWKFIW